MKKDTKVAKVADMHIREWWIYGRKAAARMEAKDKRKEAREHVGIVVKQDALQCGVETAATTTCTPLTKMRMKSLKKHLTTMKSCKCGVRWKKVKMSSGKRRSADETNTR